MEYESQPTQGRPKISPANMLRVRVIHREEIAPGIASVSIALIDTIQAPAPYLPGQFVTLALPTPRETLYRSYTLCSDGDPSRPWELTLKRMEAGAVSTRFFDSVLPDTLLYASLPCGDFTLPAHIEPQEPMVMVALGTGIAPIMGLLRAINRMPEGERPTVHLHYASRSREHEIFGAELSEIDRDQRWLRQWVYYSEEGQQLTADDALAHSDSIAAGAYWYICGPASLKQTLQAHLQRIGVAESYIHSEVFATPSSPAYGAEDVGGAAMGHVNPVSHALVPVDRTDDYLLSRPLYSVDEVTLAGDSATTAKLSAIRQFIGAADTHTLVRLGVVACLAVMLVFAWRLTDQHPISKAQASLNTISQNQQSVDSGSASPVASPQPPTPQPASTRVPPTGTPTTHATVSHASPSPTPTTQQVAARPSRAQPSTSTPVPTAPSQPAATATPQPVVTVTPAPAATATPAPTATATPVPVATSTPTPAATATPTPVATATPAPVATAAPTPVATSTPTPAATATPTPAATASPSPVTSPVATPTP